MRRHRFRLSHKSIDPIDLIGSTGDSPLHPPPRGWNLEDAATSGTIFSCTRSRRGCRPARLRRRCGPLAARLTARVMKFSHRPSHFIIPTPRAAPGALLPGLQSLCVVCLFLPVLACLCIATHAFARRVEGVFGAGSRGPRARCVLPYPLCWPTDLGDRDDRHGRGWGGQGTTTASLGLPPHSPVDPGVATLARLPGKGRNPPCTRSANAAFSPLLHYSTTTSPQEPNDSVRSLLSYCKIRMWRW